MRNKIADIIRNNQNGDTDWDEMLDQLCDLYDVVKPLKGKKEISFGIWKMKCKDIEYIDRKLLKYKGVLMDYKQLEKEYNKIKHTL